MTTDQDQLHRFLFEHAGVRGALVSLDAAWRAVLERHPYPAAVQGPLGEALAAVLLLTATLKFEGSLILQVQGDGPLRSIVTQATHQRTVRGLARWQGAIVPANWPDLVGQGRLVLSLQARDGEPYQGVVPLAGDSLASAIEGYFATSEQLPTRLWLAADGQRATGLMLQRMPGAATDQDAWNRTCQLGATVNVGELLGLSAADLLRRLFHQEDLRLFEPEPAAFRCGCSRQRIADTLRALGPDEVNAIVAEQGAIDVTCEFCNRDYRFDAVDARELFAHTVPATAPAQRH